RKALADSSASHPQHGADFIGLEAGDVEEIEDLAVGRRELFERLLDGQPLVGGMVDRYQIERLRLDLDPAIAPELIHCAVTCHFVQPWGINGFALAQVLIRTQEGVLGAIERYVRVAYEREQKVVDRAL